jgi:tetratricopeptide (TPR) repeat protein
MHLVERVKSAFMLAITRSSFCSRTAFMAFAVHLALFCALPVMAQGSTPTTGSSSPSPLSTGGSPQARELNSKGIELQSSGKLKEAVDCYRRAIQINPSAAGYHNNLALALKDLDQCQLAEAEARIALKLRPQRADYHFNLGIILQRQKKLAEAEAAFRQAIQMDPADTDSHFRLAQILLAGKVNSDTLDNSAAEAAEQEIKLALMLKPDRSEYCELLGDIYLKSKKLDEAFNQYKKVVEIRGYTAATIPGELKSKIDFIKTALKSTP